MPWSIRTMGSPVATSSAIAMNRPASTTTAPMPKKTTARGFRPGLGSWRGTRFRPPAPRIVQPGKIGACPILPDNAGSGRLVFFDRADVERRHDLGDLPRDEA